MYIPFSITTWQVWVLRWFKCLAIRSNPEVSARKSHLRHTRVIPLWKEKRLIREIRCGNTYINSVIAVPCNNSWFLFYMLSLSFSNFVINISNMLFKGLGCRQLFASHVQSSRFNHWPWKEKWFQESGQRLERWLKG